MISFRYILQILVWSVRLNKLLPFLIYSPVKIRIKKDAKLFLKHRLILGPRESQALVSADKIVINLNPGSVCHIGSGVSFGPGVKVILKDNANLIIGDNTYLSSDLHLESVNNIEIGNGCAISWGVTMIDDDHHTYQLEQSSDKGSKAELKVGNKVWIGCNATLLKGTIIGDNCIVAAGSVVRGEFPSNVLIAGNPARIINKVVSWQ